MSHPAAFPTVRWAQTTDNRMQEAVKPVLGRRSFQDSSNDYSEDEGTDNECKYMEETDKEAQLEHSQVDHSSMSSEQSYQYGGPTSPHSSAGMSIDNKYRDMLPDTHRTVSNDRLPAESGSGDTTIDTEAMLEADIDHRLDSLETWMEQYSHNIHTIKELLETHLLGSKTTTSARPSAGAKVMRSKDSSANYFCVRTSMIPLPDRLPTNVIAKDLGRINSGHHPKYSFLFDWGAPLQYDWNLHIQKNFLADFWANVDACVYSANLIPEKYQNMDEFNIVYSWHMSHLKKCWTEQQKLISDADIQRRGKCNSRNSQIGTNLLELLELVLMSNLPHQWGNHIRSALFKFISDARSLLGCHVTAIVTFTWTIAWNCSMS
ncbi:hypothetical protein BD769DRAFT_1392816 [Suillus cothurnatus]|nr:hypothetical protein BD769DRAFT_1392816 [Suillus cothurnatus]